MKFRNTQTSCFISHASDYMKLEDRIQDRVNSYLADLLHDHIEDNIVIKDIKYSFNFPEDSDGGLFATCLVIYELDDEFVEV